MALPNAAPPKGIEHLRNLYEFDEEGETEAFLEERPFLVPLLEEARGHLATHFGPDVPARLDPVYYEDEDYRALFVRIGTKEPTRDAMDRLDAFFEGWWLDALPADRGFLHFDIDHR